MAELVNFNAQIAPLEHVEKIALREQAHDQISRQALLREAPRMLSKENERTGDALPGERQKIEDRPGKEKQKSNRHPAARTASVGRAEPEDGGEDASPDVWSGNIVNLKV